MINNTSSQIEIDILVDGKPVKQYVHDGRFYIQANKGSEYEIRVRNHLNSRILAEFSIDGANPLSGGKSGDGAGYVIGARDSYTLKGYRVSDDTVNAFKFSDKKNSYAVKSKDVQDGTNVGVIGVVIHTEKIELSIKSSNDFWREQYEKDINLPYVPRPWTWPYDPWYEDYPPYNPWGTPVLAYYPNVTWHSTSAGETDGRNILRSCSNNLVATNAVFSCSVASQEAETTQDCFGLGTEFSDKEIIDRVREVSFDKGSVIAEFQIFYTDRESLLKLGVPIIKETKVSFPQAFPKKYCSKPE